MSLLISQHLTPWFFLKAYPLSQLGCFGTNKYHSKLIFMYLGPAENGMYAKLSLPSLLSGRNLKGSYSCSSTVCYYTQYVLSYFRILPYIRLTMYLQCTNNHKCTYRHLVQVVELVASLCTQLLVWDLDVLLSLPFGIR